MDPLSAVGFWSRSKSPLPPFFKGGKSRFKLGGSVFKVADSVFKGEDSVFKGEDSVGLERDRRVDWFHGSVKDSFHRSVRGSLFFPQGKNGSTSIWSSALLHYPL